MELTPEERRRIYEEEKAKIEREQSSPPSTSPTPQNSAAYKLGATYQQVRRSLLKSPVIIGFLVVIVLGILAMAVVLISTDNNNSNANKQSSGNYNYQFYTSTPQPSPTVDYSAPVASSDPIVASSDPINDTSEEGIRLNMLQAAEGKITYEHLKKNADSYEGEPWTCTGRVFQIQESGGQTFALVSLDSWGSKLMAVKANFTTEFLEKDQVTVVGYLTGNYSYTSVAGYNMTVPAMDARAILKPSDATRIKVGKPISKK